MTPITAGETILQAIDYIQSTYEADCQKQSELDKMLCDLDHKLEFTNIDIQRGYQLAKQRQDVLHERRRIKDEMELLAILNNRVTNTPNGKKFVMDLTAHLGGAKKRQAQLEHRVYSPRSETFQVGEVTPCE